MNNYQVLLKDHNIKVTPQRLTIVEELYGCVHLSVEELYEAIKKKFPSISLATVYKNINAMLENGFIQEVKIPHAKSKYELTKEPHSHIMCQKCGKVEDVRLDLSSIGTEAENLTGYKINENALILSGTCPECMKL